MSLSVEQIITSQNMLSFGVISRLDYAKMPTFIKRKSKRGLRYKAEVCRSGIRKSRTFESKQAAQAWAGQLEAEIIAGDRGEIPDKTFGELLTRYGHEVSPGKKGARWEAVRIAKVCLDTVSRLRLKDLDATGVAKWRDRRLAAVSEASVRREWNLLSAACNIAVNEWKWLKTNPFNGVRRPSQSQHRNRLASDAELSALQFHATTEIYAKVMRAARFAVETGMRAGEITGLTWDRISGSVARLEDTKNGTRREVPLSAAAVHVLGKSGEGSVFSLTSAQLDVHWRTLNRITGIRGLHFHDLRHTATVRLAMKLNTLELARMLGIKDLRILLVYYNETAENIAKKL